MKNTEIIFLVIIIFFIIIVVGPKMTNCDSNKDSEDFTVIQNVENMDSYDANAINESKVVPKGDTKNYESVIYDNETKSVMTGSQFMKNTGLITPQWIAPAWNPDAYGPSSKGSVNVSDYENDSRMLYNKCSLSCCSSQYPTPFQGTDDPNICKNIANKKYLSSNFTCQNNLGGSGCLCMTQKQVKGMQTGFSDYFVDKNLGY